MKIDFEHLEALLPRYELAGPRYTSYPTAPSWGESFGAEHYREMLGRIDTADPAGLSLYVHVPFCKSLCHFCACNRVITRKDELPARYLDVIEREVDAVRAALSGAPEVVQLHLGGGTPTHLTPDQLRGLLGKLAAAFPVREGAEVSIEVDPRVTHDAHIDALEACGFNRISMGVQDFDARVQEAVHRIQSVEQVRALVERARGSGFEGVNFDLIYGLPFQTVESFDRTIDRVIDLDPDRIALYSYAHVTWVAKQQRGFERHDLPSGALKLEIMLRAIRRFLEAGYDFIGMDHFAKPEDELARASEKGELHRNFMGYTTRTCRDLLAFGPSGISELDEGYAQSVRELPDWEARVGEFGLATFRGHSLSDEDRKRSWVIKRIMCQNRVASADYREAFGEEFGAKFADEIASLAIMEQDGLLSREPDGSITITPPGRVLVRNVAMAFDAYLPEQQREGARLFSKTV